MSDRSEKSDQAFRTISELAAELGVPQHILRYWETRFPQLKPLQRAGNRRYYRPADVALARRIHRLLEHDGYTIRGVQQLLASGEAAPPTVTSAIAFEPARPDHGRSIEQLKKIRALLVEALESTTA